MRPFPAERGVLLEEFGVEEAAAVLAAAVVLGGVGVGCRRRRVVRRRDASHEVVEGGLGSEGNLDATIETT